METTCEIHDVAQQATLTVRHKAAVFIQPSRIAGQIFSEMTNESHCATAGDPGLIHHLYVQYAADKQQRTEASKPHHKLKTI